MAHNICSFVGRQSAWHGLGTVTGKHMTWEEVCAHGLDYTVSKERLISPLDPTRSIEAFGTFRSDNGEFLGTVGADYSVLQHKEAFGMIDGLMGEVNGAHYETAGSLGKGEKVWGLADLKMNVTVGKESNPAYLAFATSYDGSLGHRFWLTWVRIVCQNTLNMALSAKSAASFSIRHTKFAQNRVDDAKLAIANIKADVTSMSEKLNMLAQRKASRETVTEILDRLFPKPKKADGTDGNESRRQSAIAQVLMNYESNDGNAYPEQRGSLYNVLNSITEYVDHQRTQREGGRQEAAIFGSGDKLKQTAMYEVLSASGKAESMPTVQYYSAPAPNHTDNASLLDSIIGTTVR